MRVDREIRIKDQEKEGDAARGQPVSNEEKFSGLTPESAEQKACARRTVRSWWVGQYDGNQRKKIIRKRIC